MNNLYIISILVILSFSKANSQNGKFSNVFREKAIMFREYCPTGGSFSFCTDGYEQPYRSTPYFIEYSKIGLLSSYQTVYYIEPFYIRQDSFQILTDTISKYITKTNKIDLYNAQLRKKVIDYYKRNKLNRNFDGYLHYAAFQIDFDYMIKDSVSVTIPSLVSNKIITDVNTELRVIKKIYSIKPLKVNFKVKL